MEGGKALLMNNDRVLIIDDDPEIQNAYRAILAPGDEGENTFGNQLNLLMGQTQNDEITAPLQFTLDFASQGPEGVDKAASACETNNPFAVAFIDIRMPPGFDGMETAARIRRIDANIEIVIVTAYSDRSREEIVQTVGAPEKLLFLRKPFDPEELIQLALSLTAKWNLARKAEEQQRNYENSEARFRGLVETTSDWVWETDEAGKFTYCSPLCEKIYGYAPNELQGRSLFETLVHPDEIGEGRDLFSICVERNRGFNNIERRSLTKEGEVIYIETSGIPVADDKGRIIGFRGIDRDITKRKKIEKERRELEAQYRQSQKLEALGTLAGGIAHDLNNVLTPIMGGAQLSLMEIDAGHPIHDNLRTIEDGVQKAADLIHQILAFSRKQVLTTVPLNLTFLIHDFANMLRRLIREDINIAFNLEDPLWTIDGDKNQMEQILINLVVNARDAISGSGEITIETVNKSLLKNDPVMKNLRLDPGDYVILSVSDSGHGMDSETLGRIFDPFFTTKDPGRGTGLGLSTAYGIVKQHGGDILVDSIPGKGTRFDIYFLRAEENDFTEDDAENVPKAVDGGRETILLVEDDSDVRSASDAILTHYGYQVILATNGDEAIRIFNERRGDVDLLFTDVVMPSMGGLPLADMLREHKPSLPVIFMSGYPFDTNTKMLAKKEGNDFIQKPFKPMDLAHKIRRLLDVKGQNKET